MIKRLLFRRPQRAQTFQNEVDRYFRIEIFNKEFST